MKDVILWDLDNSLACHAHRDGLVPPLAQQTNPQAWAAFNMACEQDQPFEDMIRLVHMLQGQRSVVHYLVTSRSEIARHLTEHWLASLRLNMDRIIMRREHDTSPATAFKAAAIQRIGADRIMLAIDDDPDNVRMMQQLGITVLQVHHPV